MRRLSAFALALAGSVTVAAQSVPAASADEQFVPLLTYRTGAYAPNGIPLANGQIDYFTMINERDGGINGVTIAFEECDTAYNVDKGVACYERLKDRGATGATVVSPFSTDIAYALLERAAEDQVPLLTLGYGRTDTADGTVFPYVFPLPTTYASQASSLVQYIRDQESGDPEGKQIGLVYHDSAYGNEPIPTLEALAEEMGFELHLFPVAHPGLEQKATWLNVGRRVRPDWVLLWGWGVMNATAIKEAAEVGFPIDRVIGSHWAGAEVDVAPAGERAVGYLAANFHSPGSGFGVHQDIREHVYAQDNGAGEEERIGEVLYNRGVVNSAIIVEAIRVAQGIHGVRPLSGGEVRDGFENLNLTQERLAELGLDGLMNPVSITCADHEGGGAVFVQQWDGTTWQRVSEWYAPMTEFVRPLIEASAAAHAEANGITPRSCPST